jgi:hypothetical protein
MTPWLVAALAGNKLGIQDIAKVTDDILAGAHDLQTLYSMIDDLAKRLR